MTAHAMIQHSINPLATHQSTRIALLFVHNNLAHASVSKHPCYRQPTNTSTYNSKTLLLVSTYHTAALYHMTKLCVNKKTRLPQTSTIAVQKAF